MDTIGNSIATSLNEERQATQRLIDLLTQEQAQLLQADIEGLNTLIEEKTKLIGRLSELTLNRYRILANAKFDAAETGMEAWLKTANNATVRKAWSELLEAAKSAKELNRINGLLIGRHLVHNQQALNTLQGNQPGGNFYGPDGQSTVRTSARGLAIG